jgi:hypothetical protein
MRTAGAVLAAPIEHFGVLFSTLVAAGARRAAAAEGALLLLSLSVECSVPLVNVLAKSRVFVVSVWDRCRRRYSVLPAGVSMGCSVLRVSDGVKYGVCCCRAAGNESCASWPVGTKCPGQHRTGGECARTSHHDLVFSARHVDIRCCARVLGAVGWVVPVDAFCIQVSSNCDDVERGLNSWMGTTATARRS